MTPTTDGGASGRPGFGAAWDDYARRSQPAGDAWPGDEWGDERLWSAWFRRLFEAHGVRDWRRAVEIGQGSGKYTTRVLASAGNCEVLALDVSSQFQALCGQRLEREVAAGRLHLQLIDERDPDPIRRAVEARGWGTSVDAVYSIDTLVHLTTTQLAMLLLSATGALRVGGWFIGTFADCTNPSGWRKLVTDIPRVVGGGGAPETGCFHWNSPQTICSLAAPFGYDVALCEVDPEHGRDGLFVFRFADPAAAAAARALRDPA